MPQRDAWARIRAYLEESISAAVEDVSAGRAATYEDYKGSCKRIAAFREVREKISEILGNPDAPGEDV